MSGLDLDLGDEYSDDPQQRTVEILIEETGLALREAIKKKGGRQVDVAAKLGRAQSHVSLAMSGRQNLTLRSMAEIAWAAGIGVEVVFTVPEEGEGSTNGA